MKTLSVRTWLLGVTAVLGVTLVGLLGDELVTAWKKREDARLIREITRVSGDLLIGFQNARLDRNNTVRSLRSEPVGMNDLTRTQRERARQRLDKAVAEAHRTGLVATTPGFAEFITRDATYRKLLEETANAINMPRDSRPKALADTWLNEVTTYLDALKDLGEVLERRILTRDSRVDALLMVKQTAVEARLRAGLATLVVSNGTAGSKVTLDMAPKLHGDIAAAKALIERARVQVADFSPSAKLSAALDNAIAQYSNPAFQEAHIRQFHALAAGEKPPLSGQQWSDLFVPALNGIADLGETALSEAQIRAGMLAEVAEDAFLFHAVLLALCVVGVLLSAYIVLSRVTNPLLLLESRMRDLAEGRLDVEAPFTGRQDEIGALGRAMATFRVNMAEAEKLRAESAEQERLGAELRRRETLELADSFDAAVSNSVREVAGAAAELHAAAQTLSEAASATTGRSLAVGAASEQATTNVASVASATEELSASISEIANQVEDSNTIAQAAVSEVERATIKVSGLANAANEVGSIVTLIRDIAGQTNLLALNATIEAARAGEAGKGFAVVASEVKHLADQTGRATAQIANQISDIQSATGEAANAIRDIGATIDRMSRIAQSIAVAMGQQGQATQDIARNIAEASSGTADVASNIILVNDSATRSSETSGRVLVSADRLSNQASALSRQLADFLSRIRAA